MPKWWVGAFDGFERDCLAEGHAVQDINEAKFDGCGFAAAAASISQPILHSDEKHGCR